MAVMEKQEIETLFADKDALRDVLEEQDRRCGFVPDPDASPERLRDLMMADGVRPEDNAFSREIVAMREE